METLIVADAGPLIALAKIDALGLLSGIAERVIVPEIVFTECTSDLRRPDAQAIADALATGLIASIVPKNPSAKLPLAGLGPGESAAIVLAADENAPILLDERRARAVARERGLRVIGTLGILVIAKHRGIIGELRPLLTRMTDRGYYLSPRLIAEALRKASEA